MKLHSKAEVRIPQSPELEIITHGARWEMIYTKMIKGTFRLPNSLNSIDSISDILSIRLEINFISVCKSKKCVYINELAMEVSRIAQETDQE